MKRKLRNEAGKLFPAAAADVKGKGIAASALAPAADGKDKAA